MAQTGIAEVRPPHESILDILIAEPFITLAQLSARTGYSISWLSQIKRSGCFRAEYERRRGDIEAEIMLDIPAKLNAAAHLAIDKLTDKLEKTQDQDFILDSFDKVLHRAGFAPKVGTGNAPVTNNTQNNFFSVPKEAIQQAREKIINGSAECGIPALPSGTDEPGLVSTSELATGVANAEVAART